jgi:hypothetical protein
MFVDKLASLALAKKGRCPVDFDESLQLIPAQGVTGRKGSVLAFQLQRGVGQDAELTGNNDAAEPIDPESRFLDKEIP